MANRLFRRTCKLALWTPNAFFSDGSNAIEITDLRVAFVVEKTLQKEPNTATIEIFNLGQESRALLQSKPLSCRLEAGYDGATEVIFQGDIRHAVSRREGTEWVTKLQAGEGDRAFNFSVTNRSYRPGTSNRQMLADVAQDMGLRMPRNVSEAGDWLNSTVNGETFFGSSTGAIDRIVKRANATWSIQGNTLQVLKPGDTVGRLQFAIDIASGMIGSPEYGTPGAKGGAPTMSVKTLLYPAIIPGAQIKVDAESINGNFRVAKVSHEGDSHGATWMTTVEATHL